MDGVDVERVVDFRPSDIPNGVSFSSSKVITVVMQHALSAYILTLLATPKSSWSKCPWSQEFSQLMLDRWIKSGQAPVHSFYRAFVDSLDTAFAALVALEEEGYLDRRAEDGEVYLRLTPKYIAFFGNYQKAGGIGCFVRKRILRLLPRLPRFRPLDVLSGASSDALDDISSKVSSCVPADRPSDIPAGAGDEASFLPSDISKLVLIPDSVSNNPAMRAIIAFIVTYLAEQGNRWSIGFTSAGISVWAKTDSPLAPLHYRCTKFEAGAIYNALVTLQEDGYLVYRSNAGQGFFMVTDEYVQIFRGICC